MKQIALIISSMLLLIIFQYNLFSITVAEYQFVEGNPKFFDESIILPKIPINIEGNHSDFRENSIFREEYNDENCFYKLEVNDIGNKKKMKYSSNLADNCLRTTIVGILLGWTTDALIAVNKADGSAVYTAETNKYMTYSFTVIGTLIGISVGMIISYDGMVPYKDIYNLGLFKNKKLLHNKNVIVGLYNKVNANIINDFLLESTEKIRLYNKIFNSVAKYNRKDNYSEIKSFYDKQLSKLYRLKGEFETTPQYNNRIANEQIKEKEILSEYEQKVRIADEQDQIKKFEILKQIKEEIKNIEFTKSYDFEISNYNADKQSFIFNISGTEKEILIPQVKAPKFKDNISDYIVQKTFKPTLHGTWEAINDDYILINTKTNEIIPWEGSIPTYVETAVENPPILSASVELIEPSGEGYLDAEEIATLKVTLSNSGKGSAKQTRISLFQQTGSTLYYDVSNTINEILPNQSNTTEFKITVPENIESDNVEYKISFLEEQGFEPSPITFTAQTRAMLKPDIQLVDFGVVDANGDGKISKGETVDVTIRIQNIGQGNAKQVALNILENRLDNVFIISEKHIRLGDISSGETKDITFSISTNNRVNDIIEINFNIQEERPQFTINEKITLEIEKTQKQLEQIVFSGKDIEKKIEYSDDLSIDIEKNIPQSNKVNENALAVIFGIENYRNVSNVNFAYRDATIMKEYFSKTIGIPEEQIYFRANDEATLGEFRKIFSNNGWLDKRVIENKTDIYFYYAGHGAPAIKEDKAFLIPFDGDPNYPVQTGYSLETVFENLSKLNANSVTVFLDACFTGANRENEMLLAGARPVSIQLKNNYINNVTVFSATSSNEISSSYPKNKHGLFSYFLMKGMQGEADSNKDNKLTIIELFDYTKKNVSRIAGTLDREQTPQLECLEPEKIIINY